jgi:hypothetical protein
MHSILLFFFILILGVESILGPLGTAATTGLLYLPRVIVRMETLVEWTVLAGKTEVLGESLSRRHFVYHKSHLPDPGPNPGRHGGKPATNRFSYGAAYAQHIIIYSPRIYCPFLWALKHFRVMALLELTIFWHEVE